MAWPAIPKEVRDNLTGATKKEEAKK